MAVGIDAGNAMRQATRNLGYNQMFRLMAQTVSNPWLASTHAVMGVYSGTDTALRFGDPAQELAALRSGCGVFALDWRAKITATGKDRVRWLHNMVTNNVRDLSVDQDLYAFLLNSQGHIMGYL